MKIYLAGPMNGIRYLNHPAFHAAEAMLTAQGQEVFSPARADIAHYGAEFASLNHTGSEDFAAEQYGFSGREALREDLSWICANADAVALLPVHRGHC